MNIHSLLQGIEVNYSRGIAAKELKLLKDIRLPRDRASAMRKPVIIKAATTAAKSLPLMTVNGEVVLPYRAANSNDFKSLEDRWL
ncbi:hypothetical protein ScalyP_jg10088 [Parmales sp. scaly parma]|nr:hypothetical protein ScalyP_jg10088 [Parmales sp. scaly parma]